MEKTIAILAFAITLSNFFFFVFAIIFVVVNFILIIADNSGERLNAITKANEELKKTKPKK